MYHDAFVMHPRTPAGRRSGQFSEVVLSVLLRARCIMMHVRCTPEHLHADVLCSFFISGVKLFIVCQLYCATLVIHSRTPAGRRVVHVFIRWG